MIIVFGGIKGGSGKTTLATNFCVMRAKEGRRVVLIDGDDQKSSMMWSQMRESLDVRATWETILMDSETLFNPRLYKLEEEYDDIIIDVGGRDTSYQRASLAVCDLFVVPMQPKSLDIWTIESISDLVEEASTINDHLSTIVVINRADHRGCDNEDAKEIVKSYNSISCCDYVISQRKIFSNAIGKGRGVVEMKPADEKAVSELSIVYEYLTNYVTKVVTK